MMKKRIKIFAIVILAFFVMLFIFRVIGTLKYYYYLETRPCSQENTVWSSEDGKILLYVDSYNRRVYFEKSDTYIKCYFASFPGYYASIYSWDAYENERLGLYEDEHYETWNYLTVKKDTFTVRVEKSKFLNVGDIITFNKVSEGDNDN